jgi:hypothetical protein
MSAPGHRERTWIWDMCPEAKLRDGKQAVEYATKGCELTRWKDPDLIPVLAAATAETGDYDAAVKWQEKALELVTVGAAKKEFRRRLELYHARRPYRGPARRRPMSTGRGRNFPIRRATVPIVVPQSFSAAIYRD